MKRIVSFILALFAFAAHAQVVNRPIGSIAIGTTLPATCSVGQVFFKSNAAAGSNLYGCTVTNTWTVQAGGGGGTPGGSNGDWQYNNSSAFGGRTATASIDAAFGSTQGQILYRNGTVWTVLAPGSAGDILKSGGAAANPSWLTPCSVTGTPAAGNFLYFTGNCTQALLSGTGIVRMNGASPPTVDTVTGSVVGTSDTQTLTNKRLSKRMGSGSCTVTSHATPTVPTDSCDGFTITALAAAITSMTTNLSGTPTEGQSLIICFKDDGTAHAITWGASFVASTDLALPTTTTLSKGMCTTFMYSVIFGSKWGLTGKLDNF